MDDARTDGRADGGTDGGQKGRTKVYDVLDVVIVDGAEVHAMPRWREGASVRSQQRRYSFDRTMNVRRRFIVGTWKYVRVRESWTTVLECRSSTRRAPTPEQAKFADRKSTSVLPIQFGGMIGQHILPW